MEGPHSRAIAAVSDFEAIPQPPEKNTPPLNMEYFHNLLAESTNDESLAEGNYKLRYKMSDTASKAPWIGLETDEDADACQETVVNGYLYEQQAQEGAMDSECKNGYY
jgi:hypothetical protein